MYRPDLETTPRLRAMSSASCSESACGLALAAWPRGRGCGSDCDQQGADVEEKELHKAWKTMRRRIHTATRRGNTRIFAVEADARFNACICMLLTSDAKLRALLAFVEARLHVLVAGWSMAMLQAARPRLHNTGLRPRQAQGGTLTTPHDGSENAKRSKKIEIPSVILRLHREVCLV